jgi:hypothetical protein
MARVTIETHVVGVNFGVEATVRYAANGQRIHDTETFPLGSQATAYRHAAEWADEHGHTVVEDDDA